MYKKICLIIVILFFAWPHCMLAQQTIKGSVTSGIENQPLAGVNVILPGSRKAVVTDKNGNFIITINALPDTLRFSHAGFSVLEVPIAGHINIPLKITMQARSTELDEVVVNTGYQLLPKERASGAFTKIDSTTIQLQQGVNIIERLEGVTNSMVFDKNPNRPPITIRGLSSIYGSKNPLVVLDNFPYEGDINLINPNDVESISLLKDAAAASIWGTKAGNGVLVITTKKSKFNQPVRVSIRSGLIIQARPDIANIKNISSSDFINLEKFLFKNGYYDNQINDPSHPFLTPVVELLKQERNQQLTTDRADAAIDLLRKNNFYADYERYFLKRGVTQQNHLEISGGSNKYNYHISGGYDYRRDNLSVKFDRTSFKMFQQFKPLAALVITGTLVLNSSHEESGLSVPDNIRLGSKQMYPYGRLVNESGHPQAHYMNAQTFIDTVGNGLLLDWRYFPLTDDMYNKRIVKSRNVIAKMGINYEIVPGLNIDVVYQKEYGSHNTRFSQAVGGYAARNLINSFSQINFPAGTIRHMIPVGDIVNTTYSDVNHNYGKLQLNYKRDIGKNNITAIAGTEIRELNNASSAFRIYGYNPNTGTIENVDYVNTYPQYITGDYVNIPTGNGVSQTINRFTSFFANASYTYNQRYIITASGRRDASNLFGVKSNEKGVPLWSAGLAWVLSKEKFWDISSLKTVKLRTTYGFSGNVDNTRSAVTTMQYVSSGAAYTGLPYGYISQYPNPGLRWEKVKMINVGLDMIHPSERFSMSADYYRKTGLDLFGLSPIDYTTGVGNTMVKNVANMTANGVDFATEALVLKKRLRWKVSANINYVKTKVTNYFQSTELGNFFLSSGNTISPLVGKPVYSLLSYQWAGLDEKGNPQGIAEGKPSTDYNLLTGDKVRINDLVFSGSATPQLFGNVLNTISWKGISIVVNLTYKGDYYFRRPTIHYTNLLNNGQGHNDYARRWQNAGDELKTNVPSFVYPLNSRRDNFYTLSETTVAGAAHIRLQFLRAEYLVDFKNSATILKRLAVSVNASNLGILWRKNNENIDPDYPDFWPAPPQYGINVSAGF